MTVQQVGLLTPDPPLITSSPDRNLNRFFRARSGADSQILLSGDRTTGHLACIEYKKAVRFDKQRQWKNISPQLQIPPHPRYVPPVVCRCAADVAVQVCLEDVRGLQLWLLLSVPCVRPSVGSVRPSLLALLKGQHGAFRGTAPLPETHQTNLLTSEFSEQSTTFSRQQGAAS